MQAYDKTELENSFLIVEAKRLFQMKFISKEQLAIIIAQLPSFHSSSIFIRLGFFLLGCILFSSIAGSLALVFGVLLESNFEIFPYFYAIIAVVGSELLAKSSYYRHGLDDAFVLIAQASFCTAIGISTESITLVFALLFLVGLFSCIRYVNTISALISCVGITGLLFTLITEHHIIDELFLPFVGLLLASGIYFAYYKLRSISEYYPYKDALDVTKIFSLVLAYASVNYMVVRELSESLMGITVTDGNDIPLAFLFYGLTFIVPFFYIVYALYKKDRIMLTIGLLALGYSFFTIRFYYSLMPLEGALVLGGLVLFAISFFAIRKLQNATTGITFQPDRDSNSSLLLNAQALVINSQINTQPVTTSQSKMPFGGGDFSGGGSGGNF